MTITDDTTIIDLELHRAAGNIGAYVDGIDLSRELPPQTADALVAALHAHKVLFFRDQHDLDHAAQIAFSRIFGAVTDSHPYDDDAPTEFPQILTVDNREYERKFGVKAASYTSEWHTDVTPLVNPPAVTILRADVAPERGGDTSWTNLAAAYAGLPESLKELVDGLRAEHRFGGRKPVFTDASEYGRKVASAPLVAEHPVVRVHPRTGEKILFVTPGFTSRIIGYSRRQSDALLDLLFDEVTNPAYTVRFRWRAGSVAVWDNRATAHLAPSDINHLDVRRTLFRTTIEGDVPVGPDGSPSVAVSGDRFVARD
ncbi:MULTISPECIES: TauD/TfdA family dioxygenase [unclassified Gordonia (in: high G+C Gram-positive bacteria)]|uniref:TauD/TfdA dioxygenase family protein n=1 Tax=unclassified Gordonia (in: high G+C Gram-positive bacteria) TaxID=2657482 RepID=UPI001F0F9DB6|nr:TauD/TfdA family dioxygenase [Gordonia sp. ABSL49_1]MCH5641863.1 TauD/TfdA family dioxygenase [Gordonia sp. ABSL49_1]